MGPGLLPIALLLAVSWIPFGVVAQRLLARPPRVAPALLLVPAAWVIGEFARSTEYLAGPWGLMGASQWDNLGVLALASLGGAWAVGFVVLAVNVALAAALMPGSARSARLGALVAGALTVAAAMGYGYVRPDPSTGRTVRVAGVQTGIATEIEGTEIDRFEAALDATLAVRGSDAELVVWGESSVGAVGRKPESLVRIADVSRAVGAPILVNIDAREGEGGIFKSSVLVGPDGAMGRYDKMRLVPFGEYIPMRRAFGWLSAVSEAPVEDRRRGTDLALLDSNGLMLGPLVCFESAFPDMSREVARMGAELIVIQSATTTFQESWAPAQHASLAALRAVESGRPIVHATLTGASAVFDAAGRRLAFMDTDDRGVYIADVPLATGRTPFVILGAWVPLACALVFVPGLLVTALRRLRAGRSPPARPPIR